MTTDQIAARVEELLNDWSFWQGGFAAVAARINAEPMPVVAALVARMAKESPELLAAIQQHA